MIALKHSPIRRAIPFLIAVCFVSLPAYAKYSGGSGTADNPYQIATAADLIALGETPEDYDKHFLLTADIDLDPNLPGRKVFDKAVIAPDTNPTNVGRFDGTPFTGVFDGNGHTISHLTIKGKDFLGLFGQLGGWPSSVGEVKNLGVVGVNIAGSGGYIGGLVGQNNGSLVQCYSTGAVSGTSNVGGLVGHNYGTVAQCYSNAAVSGVGTVGGLVGDQDGRVTCCYSSGAVSGSWSVGGLVGETADVWGVYVVASFWDIQSSGQPTSRGTGKTTAEMQNIQTYQDAGWDFVDEIEDGTHEIWQMPPGGGYPILAIFSGYTPPQLQGTGTPGDPFLISDALELGAMWRYSPDAHYRLAADIDLSGVRWSTAVIPSLAGTFDGDGHTILHLTIKTIEAEGYGGLFGYLRSGAEVKNLGVVDANITGSGVAVAVGGLVAQNYGHVTRCYSTGGVRGRGMMVSVGGLVRQNYGNVTYCYSTCSVSGGGAGLVGENDGSVVHCYSTGAVSGTSGVGGLVRSNRGTVTGCFWDTQTSGQNTSAGGTGKTTAQMQTAKTFLDAGWDFVGETANGTEDIWWILEGKDYPRLWWEAHN